MPNSLSKKQTLPNLQKLLPRSFSSLSSNMTWTAGLNTVDSTNDGLSISSLMVANTRGSFQSQLSTYNQMNDLVKGTRYFFFKFGSSFVGQSRHRKSISSEQKTNETNDIKFSLSHLQKLLTIAKRLLNKDLLQILDEIASSVYGV
jgi:phosphatidylinositol 4-kinase